MGVKKSLLTTSCTHALELSGILLNIKTGDEVIVPSFTFVTTVNAFVLHGAKPVFIDIRSDTLNMDEKQLENLITNKTKAIVPVHYAGVGCEMDKIMSIAHKYNIFVIEDNAHGLFGKYNNKYLGTFGTFATQSFHETKNFSCGEGGSLLINDEDYIEERKLLERKVQTEVSISEDKWINIHGWTLVQVFYHQIFWQPFCTLNWNKERQYKSNVK